VTTNLIITKNQSLGVCAEDPSFKDYICDPKNPHEKCHIGTRHPTGNGK